MQSTNLTFHFPDWPWMWSSSKFHSPWIISDYSVYEVIVHSELTCAGRRKEFDQRSIWSCYSCDQPCTLGLRTQMQDLIMKKDGTRKKFNTYSIMRIVLPHLRFTILDASQLDWWKNCSPGGATCTRSMVHIIIVLLHIMFSYFYNTYHAIATTRIWIPIHVHIFNIENRLSFMPWTF